MKRVFLVLLCSWMLVSIAAGTGRAQTDVKKSLADKAADIPKELRNTAGSAFIDQLANNGLPPAAGELVGALQQSNVAKFSAEAWKGGQVGKDLAAACRFNEWTGRLLNAIGRASAVVDVGGKISTGESREAAITGVTALLGELPNISYGQGLMKAAKITPPILNAVLVSFAVWRESSKQLESARKSVVAESMMGTVEIMCRVGKEDGRSLGEGNPIPTTQENLDKVWNRILTDNTFRKAFSNYVTEDLGKEFPDPGWFDTINEYMYGAVGVILGAGTSPKEGFANANAGGKSEDSSVDDRLNAQSLKSIKEKKAEILPYIASLLGSLNKAAKTEEQGLAAVQAVRKIADQLGQVDMSLDQLMERVQKAATMLGVVTVYANKCDTEISEAIKKKDYQSIRVHMRLIEDYTKDVIAWIPSTGPLSAERNADLAKLKSAYALACKGIADLKSEIENKIQQPDRPEEYKGAQVELSPESLYKRYMLPSIKPFEWGGTGGTEAAKKNFISMMGTKNRSALVAVINAWSRGDYNTAVADTSKDTTADRVSTDSYNKTIADYRSALYVNFPIPDEVNQYKPADEGAKAWGIAIAMFRDAVKMKVSMVEEEQAETLDWMVKALAGYDKLLQEMAARAYGIETSLPNISAYKSTDGFRAIETAEKWQGYGGIPVQSQPGSYSKGPFSIPNMVYDIHGSITSERYKANQLLQSLSTKCQASIDHWEQAARKWDTIMADAQGDIQAIREYINPDFLNNERFNARQKERNSIPQYISQMKSKSASLSGRLQTDISNMDSDIFWIARVGVNWTAFMKKVDERGLHSDRFTPPFGKLSGGGDYAVLTDPYVHLVTNSEKAGMIDDLFGFYTASNLHGFSTKYMKFLKPDFDAYFSSIKSAKAYPEENLLVQCNNHSYKDKKFLSSSNPGKGYAGEWGLVTAGGVSGAKTAVAALVPGDDKFSEALIKVFSEIPFNIAMGNKPYAGDPSAIQPNRLPGLWNEYKGVVDAMNKKISEHEKIVAQRDDQQRQENNKLALQKLPPLFAEIEARISAGNSLIQSARAVPDDDAGKLKECIDKLNDFVSQKLLSQPYPEFYKLSNYLIDQESDTYKRSRDIIKRMDRLSTDMNTLIADLMRKLNNSSGKINKAITDFYGEFKDAYQSKNESTVMSMLEDGWSAGDGTTLADLQSCFNNMFSVFDTLNYSITGIKIQPSREKGLYRVEYELLITGRIFDNDIRREEKSSVVEEVRVSSNGKVKIAKTLEGKFWYVK